MGAFQIQAALNSPPVPLIIVITVILFVDLQRWRILNQPNAKSKSEKFPPPHQDGALGHTLDKSHNGPISFGTSDNSFVSSKDSKDSKSSRAASDTAATVGPSKKRTKREGGTSRRFIRAFIPTAGALSVDFRWKNKGSASEVFPSRR